MFTGSEIGRSSQTAKERHPVEIFVYLRDFKTYIYEILGSLLSSDLSFNYLTMGVTFGNSDVPRRIRTQLPASEFCADYKPR